MREFTLYNVFTYDDMKWIESEYHICKEDLNSVDYGTIDCDYDYAQYALVDEDNKYIFFWDDNIHSDIKEFMNGFKTALKSMNFNFIINKKYIYEKDLKKYKGVRYIEVGE